MRLACAMSMNPISTTEDCVSVLVTGGLGAVGAPLADCLRRNGHSVVVLDRVHSDEIDYVRCDVSEYRQLEEVFKARDYEIVYHLAAEFGRNNGEEFYETLWKTNAIGTKNLLRLQERLGFKLVFFSTSEVYGDHDGTMSEGVTSTSAIRQLNDYAISKWVNEQQIMNSMERHGTETVRVRLFNTYGPGEHYSPYRSVICQFVYRAMHRMPYTVYLDHHRTSSYIDDTVRTLANIAANFVPGAVYNISGDEYHDIRTLSDMILAKLARDDSLVEYVERETHNTRDKHGDNSAAKRDLGHAATVGLDEGIDRTIAWQRAVYFS